MENEVNDLTKRVEKLDKTLRVLIHALSQAGVIELVDKNTKKKVASAVRKTREKQTA